MSQSILTSSNLRPTEWKGLHVEVNKILHAWITSNCGQVVPLGVQYTSMSYSDAERNLILHRMSKKFEVPDNTTAESRKIETIKSMIEYDSQWAVRWFQPARDRTLDAFTRHQLYRARHEIRKICSGFTTTVDDIGFPSGETVRSARGDVSLYAKMRDASQLNCTEENFLNFTRLAYSHIGLRYVIKRHFRNHVQSMGRAKVRALLQWVWQAACDYNRKKAKYWSFVAQCRVVINIVTSARLTTVRKDNSVDRVIELDAFCNMVEQRTIAGGVRTLIKDFYDIDLDESQVVHKLLISDLTNATIDLRNASNSVWYEVVRWFLEGTKLWDRLESSRCGYVSFKHKDINIVHKLNMLAPMGNGFTFEIMTLLLLVVSRQYDSFAHVFGDDIIVDRDVAQNLIHALQYLGFHVNETKTFLHGNFRESCGGFTHSGKYITAFDFEWAEDEVDAVTLINKVFVLKNQNSSLKDALTELHDSLINLVPAALLTCSEPISDYALRKVESEMKNFQIQRRRGLDDHAGWLILPLTRSCVLNTNHIELTDDRFTLSRGVMLETRKVARLQRRDEKCKTVYNRKAFSIQRSELNWDVTFKDLKSMNCVTLILSKRNKRYTYKDAKGRNRPWCPNSNISRLLGLYYAFTGRVISPTFRETVVATEWRQTNHVL